jgi:hypothetical protein
MQLSLKLLLGVMVGLLLWCALAWINLFWFNLPWSDTWCYLGPAAGSPSIFHLEVPLWGGFLGGNHVWGLHFPGAPLIYSCLFSLVGFRPSIGVAIFVALWLALAACTGWMARQLTGKNFWAIAAGSAVLSDRCLFNIAQAQRPEFVGSIALLLLWMALEQVPPLKGKWRLYCILICLFLLPLLHPVTLITGGCVCIALYRVAYLRGSINLKTAILASLAYIIGGAALVLWFYLQPDAWSQFSDHASSVNIPFTFGLTLWRSLQFSYYPTFSGHILWAAGILFSALILISWIRNPLRAIPVGGWGAAILIISIFVEQKFNNMFYIGLILPEAVLVTLLILFNFQQRVGDSRIVSLSSTLIVVFICVHGLFWATRTLKFIGAGCPSIRTELAKITNGLPQHQHILIPVVLWEAALRDPSRFELNTLPQFASKYRREEYEAPRYGRLIPGDLVILDRFQLNQPTVSLASGKWTLVSNPKHIFQGRWEWGYDLHIWRKN